ncbi:mitochondrial ribosomal protein S28 [Arctopsyche grandis]|uniref:mitochondrial ribosomal protein S28 n=1 Tax=Arctopsyche grandis TaxID=121162 RepID=UPI00406D7D33
MLGLTALRLRGGLAVAGRGAFGARLSTTTETSPPESESVHRVSGFAKAFARQSADIEAATAPAPPDNRTFAALLRHSKFVDLGDPRGKIVAGEIVNIVENDLYIDFGWKFQCVCNRPIKNANDYVIGTKVRLMVNDLELSSRFLGSETDLTILEADCRLLNIIYTPARK